MEPENLFQVFSQVFIQSQQSFNKCDVELRTKCRTLAEKLNKMVEELEVDAFKAELSLLSTLEEDTLHILRSAAELENRREYIKESVRSLKDSTNTKVSRRK
jgi:Na+/phosphate symporter